MTLFDGFSRISTRFGQQVQIEGAGQHANDVGMVLQHRAIGRPTSPGRRRDTEDAIGLVVDQRQPAVARDREDAVAHS